MTHSIAMKFGRLLFVAASAGTLALGASSVGLATTEPPEPAGTEPAGTELAPTPTAGEPTSPEAAAFCPAAIAAEMTFNNSEDPAEYGAAFDAAIAAAPAEIRPAVETYVAEAATGEFGDAYAEMVEWMKSNCGYPNIDVAASEYSFGGVPPELHAGPTIISFANVGEEVHEILLFRVNDGVTLTLEELLALPEEEAFANVTFFTAAFAFPDEVGYGLTELTPGRYVAVCSLPEHADPEMIAQMTGPDSSAPPGADFGPPHFTLGMAQEITVS
jgi:hypothetical protein